MWRRPGAGLAGWDMVGECGQISMTASSPATSRLRSAGTVGFTTSLGFGRKLDRIKQNPRVALAYHAREHGFADAQRFVLVQGTASYDSRPDRTVLEEQVRPASIRFLGAPQTGVFWDRWLSAYYADRVLVTVQVERVLSWPDPQCAGDQTVAGTPLSGQELGSQQPPGKGTAPRVDAARAARRASKLPHILIACVGAASTESS
jgi:hypothetical protein